MMADSPMENAGVDGVFKRIGVTDGKLVYLKRGLPNFFRFSVQEILLEDVEAGRLKDSIFGCDLEIEKTSGEKVTMRGLDREEALKAAELIAGRSGESGPGEADSGKRAQGLLPDLAGRIEEIFKDEENCISRFVDLVIDKAIELKASDIHFEPLENLAIRYRIDGVLTDVADVPAGYHDRIASRIKVLARLPTYEKDVPLDGRVEKDYGPGLDLRVSTFPTVRGDKVVVRIFDSGSGVFRLDELGFGHAVFEAFEALILRPGGTILLTGPSNSGKTTTIYSALERIYELKRNTVNIATIEDPVERDLKKFSQTQIAPARGLTFSSALRAVLRQDPNVIVVGEIRDTETANTAIRAGMTGHLVISTIHSGTAPGAFVRLMEMGVEPFVLTASVSGIMAQRLVRKVCPACAVSARPPAELIERFKIEDSGFEQKRGSGCAGCAGTGYKGRTAIAELMVIDNALREALLKRSSVRELRQIAGTSGMCDLQHAGLEKVKAGLTNLEELARVLVPDEV